MSVVVVPGAFVEVLVHVAVGADELLAGQEEDPRSVVRGTDEESVEGPVSVDLAGGDASGRPAGALVDLEVGVHVVRRQLLIGLEEDPATVGEAPAKKASKAPSPLITPSETSLVVPPERS